MHMSRFIFRKQFSTSASSKYEKSRIKDWSEKWNNSRSSKPLYGQSQPHVKRCMTYFHTFQNKFCFYVSQHANYARGLLLFYRQFYKDYGQRMLFTTLIRRFQPRHHIYTFAAAACTFSWEENGISNTEIKEHIDELHMLDDKHCIMGNGLPDQTENKNIPSEWENILDQPNIKIWKLPFKDTGFMQYKVLGRFHDITARQFFAVQTDLEYRRKWDNLVIDINVIDENTKTGEQVLRWITYFPYPFNGREYVYIRRAKIFRVDNVLALLARSVEHPKCMPSRKHVRVPLYISDMVIKPHKTMDEPGLDYLLTYCDDPQTAIPSRLSTWVITAGIPDYIEKLHKASLEINNWKDVEQASNIVKSTSAYEMRGFDVNPQQSATVGAC